MKKYTIKITMIDEQDYAYIAKIAKNLGYYQNIYIQEYDIK